MATMHTEERIGEAWRLHRSGDNVGAIEIFRNILGRTPDSLDANYGLGLALRADGQEQEAIKCFQKALSLANTALDATTTTSSVDGVHGANDLDTYADDRFLMMIRMTTQRLEELGVSE